MDFEVYCDESYPDLFCSKNPHARYLMIGSLWLPSQLRSEVKQKIWELREKYKIWGEVKWTKATAKALPFYKALIDLFFSYGEQLRFRCIAVDHTQIHRNQYNHDDELGFYKFYYQVLHHWILDYNSYNIFCDKKINRDPTRLQTLNRCLSNANRYTKSVRVQALDSKQVVLIQLSDLLLGIGAAALNNKDNISGAKADLLEYFESKLGRTIGHTIRSEHKFNVFIMNLSGGW